MTIYVNWMAYTQNIKGDTMQTEGNPVSNHESPDSGVATSAAPLGAQYATVFSDDSTITISATNLTTKTGSGLTIAYPPGTPVQVPNVTPNLTTITVTEL